MAKIANDCGSMLIQIRDFALSYDVVPSVGISKNLPFEHLFFFLFFKTRRLPFSMRKKILFMRRMMRFQF